MARAHLFRPLQDGAGNLQRGATVRLYRPGTTQEYAGAIYVDPEGEQVFSQPIACPTGFLNVYLQAPVRLRVGVTPFGGGTEVIFEDIDAHVPVESAVQTPIDAIEGLEAFTVQAALSELMRIKQDRGTDEDVIRAIDVTFGAGEFIPAETVQGAIEFVGQYAEAVEGRVDAVETLNTTQDGRLDDHDDRFDGVESDLVAHDGRLDILEATDVSHDSRLDALENEPDPVGNPFQSTQSAGLPSLLGRTNSDLHYDSTSKQEYIHTGSPAGPAVTGSGNLIDATVGTGNQYATFEYTFTESSAVDLLLSFDLTDRSRYILYVNPNLASNNIGVRITRKDNNANGNVETVLLNETTGPGIPPVTNRLYEVIGSRIGSTLSISVRDTVSGQTYSGSVVDGNPLVAAGAVTLAAGSGSTVGAYEIVALGTLAWISIDEYVAPHVHSQVQAFGARTASRTLTATDGIEFFTGTDLTATLPTPVGRTGVQFTIKNLDPSPLTVATVAGQIDATATRTLAQYDSLSVVSDGTNWGVV